MAPLVVEIVDKERAVVAGENRTVECRVWGARPRPSIRWSKDNRSFDQTAVTAVSYLKFPTNWNSEKTSTGPYRSCAALLAISKPLILNLV